MSTPPLPPLTSASSPWAYLVLVLALLAWMTFSHSTAPPLSIDHESRQHVQVLITRVDELARRVDALEAPRGVLPGFPAWERRLREREWKGP